MDALINERESPCRLRDRPTEQLRVSQSLRFLQRFASAALSLSFECLPARLPFVAVPFLIVARTVKARLQWAIGPLQHCSCVHFLPIGICSVNSPSPPVLLDPGPVEAPRATDYPGVSLTINEEAAEG